MPEIICPSSLKNRRTEFATAITSAYQIVAVFSQKHQCLKYTREPFFSGVEVFDCQQNLWEKILELEGEPASTPLPTDGLSAAITHHVLLFVTPELFAKLRPEYSSLDDGWVRLIAHEFMHQLHLRMVSGDENKMGPKWFYEGLAMVGAGQSDRSNIVHNKNQAMAMSRSSNRGSYAQYAHAVNYFLSRTNLQSLIDHAADEDFEQWLQLIDSDP